MHGTISCRSSALHQIYSSAAIRYNIRHTSLTIWSASKSLSKNVLSYIICSYYLLWLVCKHMKTNIKFLTSHVRNLVKVVIKKLRMFVHKLYRFAILCKQQHFSTISLPVNKFITKSTDLLSKHALEYLHE